MTALGGEMPEMTTGPNVSWLDEELRRARAIIDDLRDVADKQQVRMVDQEQRLMALEDRLAKVQAELLKLPEAQEAAQRTRDEIVLRLAEMRQDAQKRETESLRARQIEREQDAKALQAMGVQLDRLAPLEQGMAMRQAVEQRLNEAVLRLQQDIERGNKLFPQIEESRRSLQDSLNKLLVEQRQTAGELEELRQTQPPIRNSLVSLSMNATKLEQRLSEFDGMRQELTAQQNELVERERLADRERSQTLTEWGRKLEGFTHQLESWANQMRFFADQHEKNRQTLRDIQTLAQEISQQQDRLRQMQRLSEEQMRRELREWQNENQRKWAQEAERLELANLRQGDLDTAQNARLETLEKHHEDTVVRFGLGEERVKELRADLGHVKDRIDAVYRSVWRLLQKASQSLLADLHDTFGLED
jgi:chromosome segregation ATPase